MLPILLPVSVDLACAAELLGRDKALQTRTAKARFDFFISANLRPNPADLKITAAFPLHGVSSSLTSPYSATPTA